MYTRFMDVRGFPDVVVNGMAGLDQVVTFEEVGMMGWGRSHVDVSNNAAMECSLRSILPMSSQAYTFRDSSPNLNQVFRLYDTRRCDSSPYSHSAQDTLQGAC